MLRQAVFKDDSITVRKIGIHQSEERCGGDESTDLSKLLDLGYEYVFLLINPDADFIDSTFIPLISTLLGMKIVLSGTDSLSFWFALHQELYDRAVTIHTTFIPFREHSRLLGIDSIDSTFAVAAHFVQN